MGIIIGVIIALIVIATIVIAAIFVNSDKPLSSIATVLIGSYLAASTGSLTLTYSEEQHLPLSTHELSEHFGLKSGEKYPLAINDTFGGSTGNLSAKSGFFTARSESNLRFETAVSLGFNHEDNGWLITLPTSKITYVRATEEKPGVVINLQNLEDAYYADYKALCTDPEVRWNFVPYHHYENCSEHELVFETPSGKPSFPDFVANNFSDGTIYLPPEEYDEMFNRQ